MQSGQTGTVGVVMVPFMVSGGGLCGDLEEEGWESLTYFANCREENNCTLDARVQ